MPPAESRPAPPKRIAVYTCVTGGYDRVIPPAAPVEGVDHLLFTDTAGLTVPGWQTRPMPAAPGLSPALANRRVKLLPHQVLPDHDASVYLDANIRIRASLAPFLADVFGRGEEMVLYRHPARQTVAEEMRVCLDTGRVRDPDALRREYAAYRADGFPDRPGDLSGNSILMRRHHAPRIVEAMALWWDLVAAHSGRDQISLPYVRWKLGLESRLIAPHFSIESPYFHRYPHWSGCGLRGKAYIWCASHLGDGVLFRAGHALLARSYGARAAI